MKMTKLLAAMALVGTAGTVSANTVTINAVNPPQDVATIPGQEFETKLTDAGAPDLYTPPSAGTFLSLGGSPGASYRLTFSLVAAESGFDNIFTFDGQSITETYSNDHIADFTTGALDGLSFTAVVAGGTDIGALMTFDNGTTTFDDTTEGFGVFAGAASGLTQFFVALDDNGGTGGVSGDDNHDDIIIRVDVAPVPLPAAGWMLLAGLGGLLGMRRFRKTV